MKTKRVQIILFTLLMLLWLGWQNTAKGQITLVPDGDVIYTGWSPSQMWDRVNAADDNKSIETSSNNTSTGEVTMTNTAESGNYTSLTLEFIAEHLGPHSGSSGLIAAIRINGTLSGSLVVSDNLATNWTSYLVTWDFGIPGYTQTDINSLQVWFQTTGSTPGSVKIDYIGGTLTYTKTGPPPCNSAPAISCPGPFIVNNEPGICGKSVLLEATANGDPEPTIVYYIGSDVIPSPHLFPVGTTTVGATATNSCGSASCTFDVTVNDAEVPVAICKAATVTLSGGTASIIPEDIDNGSTDNCGIVDRSLSKSNFTCSDIGDNLVTLTVTDAANNSNSCGATVTVFGSVPVCSIALPPTIYLGYGIQSVTLASTVTGGSNFTYLWSGLTTTALSCTDCANPVFSPTSEGRYQYTLTVTNEYGCGTTCSVTICVFDVRVPGFNNKVYLCHVPPGNPNNPQTLSISVNAVPAHLTNHVGDHLGKCNQDFNCEDLTLKDIGATGEIIVSADNSISTIIYPDPFTSDFTLTVESESQESIWINIYDLTGRLLKEVKNISPNKAVIISNDLKDGMYLLQVHQGSQVQQIKIIKNR